MPARSVTVIPATVNPRTHLPSTAFRKRKTGGYARVSTDKDEQFTSYEAQVDYYTKLIKSNPDWEFVKVYTDEGTSTPWTATASWSLPSCPRWPRRKAAPFPRM